MLDYVRGRWGHVGKMLGHVGTKWVNLGTGWDFGFVWKFSP